MKTVGVLLSGCGYLDGAEITESVLTFLALDMAQAKTVAIAPNMIQTEVVNHYTGEELSGESRNILVEASRITRGKITEISQVDITSLDALIIPGGYGVAKNLSTWASDGARGKVQLEVRNFILKFHQSKKPIGGLCIAPALLALLFGQDGLACTIGDDPATAKAITLTGAGHVPKSVDEIYIDDHFKIVTTPAYMCGEARSADIFVGIKKCVEQVLALS